MQGLSEDMLWASVSNNSLISVASLLKHCTFKVTGKVGFNAWTFQFFMLFMTSRFLEMIHLLSFWRVNLRMNLSLREVSHFLRLLSLTLTSLFLSLSHCKYNSGFLSFMKIVLNTMESKIHSHLYFAGEVMLLGYFLAFHSHPLQPIKAHLWPQKFEFSAGTECWWGNWWF